MNVKSQSTFFRILSLLLSMLMAISIFSIIDIGMFKTYAAEDSTSEGFSYRMLANGEIEITGYTGENLKVVIPSEIDGSPVTSIGFEAFYENQSTNITIPNTVNTIGKYAFCNCDNLTSITIPENVKLIDECAFYSCDSLTEIEVSNENINYSSKDGVLFNKDKTQLLQYPLKKDSKSYEIPYGVTIIKDLAFYNCDILENITIPNSVNTIGIQAFYGCDGLKEIDIPESVTTIGKYAFAWSGLTSVSIPNSITEIVDFTFYNCNSLTDINISEKTENIEKYAFYSCNKLTNINVADNNAKYSSTEGVLFNKSKTELIKYPSGKDNKSYKIPFGVTTIKASAFYSCLNLKDVTFPNSVTKIEDDAFWNCGSLSNLTISSPYIEFETTTFKYCENLVIYVKNGVKIIVTGDEGSDASLYQTEAKHTTDSSWIVLKDYGTAAAKTWIPAKIGTYNIKIKTKDSADRETENLLTIIVNEDLINNSTISATTITKGTEITMTGSAAGGIEDYQYQMVAKHSSDSSWTVLKDYSTTATKKWTPSKTGTYKVAIKVKDSTNKIVEKLFVLTVNDTLTNNSTISATNITYGTEITMTGSASGGISPYQYQMVAKHSTDSSWTVLKGYNTTATKKWTPSKTGTYKVAIKVKDSTGKIAEKLFTLTVNAPALTNNSTISATTITKGTEITMTGSASGGISPYQYQMVAKHSTDSSWTVLKDYSTTATKKWTPAKTGTYNVAIKVKDSTGKVVTKYFTVSVK